MSSKSVTLKKVTKTFEDDHGKQVHAVEDIDLVIKEGEFATLLGPSGCGKTTTLRMIAGFEDISNGDIYFGNENVNKISPNKRDCTMVFQSYALFPHMTVYENVVYGLKIKKMSKEDMDKKVDAIFDIMNLNMHKERMPNQLSGGQQQRVALARALVMEPSVLLFDEPLSNLDAKLRLTMRDEIRRLQQRVGITAIYVTHDQSEAMSMSDKVIVMNKGKIEQIGTPQEIYQRPSTKFVADFIGTANFFEGEIIEVTLDELVVQTSQATFTVASYGSFKKGDSVILVVRPEAVSLNEEGTYKAKVTKSVFMGQLQEYEVNFKGQDFQFNVYNPMGEKVYQEGDTVGLVFNKNSLHVIKKS
ncbi:ABC transporter ATP-binding protein [Alkalihalobacillus trypoxylicola]|uniref:ABC transporter n=1 Tax=Alkalihalobacillus trypoxylicola TaxID=519424 RepID=A0A162ENQ7_9BACI|nr:ABC transporter ATP-binding protein [Alkalihalobacillus trypoxylicola]KYG33358.1 ABC transporter [Alkalihalobacillus trypoxylicola]GAF66961.1 ABC transporter ATP-binding protein [Bacillus sp. TS-2]